MWLKLLLGLSLAAYPLLVYLGLTRFQLWQLLLLLAVIGGLRLLILRNNLNFRQSGIWTALLLLLILLLTAVFQQPFWLRLYPVLMSLLLLSLFAASLWTEKSMIQRFAELREKNITAEKRLYMRRLTMVWCGFFVCNALVAAYTVAFAPLEWWTFYNGFLSYVLMGLLFVGELLYRYLFVLRRA